LLLLVGHLRRSHLFFIFFTRHLCVLASRSSSTINISKSILKQARRWCIASSHLSFSTCGRSVYPASHVFYARIQYGWFVAHEVPVYLDSKLLHVCLPLKKYVYYVKYDCASSPSAARTLQPKLKVYRVLRPGNASVLRHITEDAELPSRLKFILHHLEFFERTITS